MQLIKKLLGLEEYVSPLDEFLAELDQKFPKPSASQVQEIAKYKRIYKLRDSSTEDAKSSSIWENF